jgi:ABC-type transporter Mla MlaB component
LAIGKKLAKPRTSASGGKTVGRPGTSRKQAASTRVAVPSRLAVPAAAVPHDPLQADAVPADVAPEALVPAAVVEDTPAAASALVSPVASPSQDPAPDAIIHLGAHLTLREAVPLRVELLERVDVVDPVGLDASGVQKVDTAGLQVLLAFTDQRRKAGNQVAWTGCSEPLRKAACQLAIEAALGLPAAGAAA